MKKASGVKSSSKASDTREQKERKDLRILIKKYGSRLGVAEALLLGQLPDRFQGLTYLLGRSILYAAKLRIELELIDRERVAVLAQSLPGRRRFEFED